MKRKLTTEERKHLVSRTFTENAVTFKAMDWTKGEVVENSVKVSGEFKTRNDLVKYVCNRYNTQDYAINPMSIEYTSKEVKYYMWDSDFMKYGFRMEVEDDEE